MAILIENKGIKKDNLFIPSFELNERELMILRIFGGQYYYPIKNHLEKVFTGKLKENGVLVHLPLIHIKYITEPTWRRMFYPLTVGEYLKKNANFNSEYATKIYEVKKWINKKTQINSLTGSPIKLLSLFATLSKSKNIIFDLDGQDPLGAEEMCEFVKENVANGGSAILIDYTDYLKNDCTKFIEIELLL